VYHFGRIVVSSFKGSPLLLFAVHKGQKVNEIKVSKVVESRSVISSFTYITLHVFIIFAGRWNVVVT